MLRTDGNTYYRTITNRIKSRKMMVSLESLVHNVYDVRISGYCFVTRAQCTAICNLKIDNKLYSAITD